MKNLLVGCFLLLVGGHLAGCATPSEMAGVVVPEEGEAGRNAVPRSGVWEFSLTGSGQLETTKLEIEVYRYSDTPGDFYFVRRPLATTLSDSQQLTRLERGHFFFGHFLHSFIEESSPLYYHSYDLYTKTDEHMVGTYTRVNRENKLKETFQTVGKYMGT